MGHPGHLSETRGTPAKRKVPRLRSGRQVVLGMTAVTRDGSVCSGCQGRAAMTYFSRKCGVAVEVMPSAGQVRVGGKPPEDAVMEKPLR
jgi:hypothetical protein